MKNPLFQKNINPISKYDKGPLEVSVNQHKNPRSLG